MALDNIFTQYGIKEVADVQFEALAADTSTGVAEGDVVLYLDTLKISTLETTVDQTEARGGKGNPPLIIWDFGKEINVTLQDALFTQASLALLNDTAVTVSGTANVRYTEEVTLAQTTTAVGKSAVGSIRYINLSAGTKGQVAAGTTVTTASLGTSGDTVKLFYDVTATTGNVHTVVINANSFPGTYKVIGDTWVRNRDGQDVAYQFVIPRAKVSGESTITMEAEGDPSVFDMNLRVLRDDKGSMIKFIKYTLSA